MKTIHTLVKDIYQIVGTKDGTLGPDIIREFSGEVSSRLTEQFAERKEKARLRLSQMGPKCPRALWYSIHRPESAEKFPPWAIIKFSYGHILEALAIALAKAAGHEVTGEQDELDVDGIKGHRDCVIDGCIVDVKSCTSLQFKKFETGSIAQDDSFGYLDQLDGYLVGSAADNLVRVKDRAYLLAIDKTLGHMCLYEHALREDSIRERIKHYREIIARDSPPDCTCRTEDEGESGNVRLAFPATYNNFKYECFPHLRTFLYARGPVYLTKVVKRPQPHIREIDKDGNTVYNYRN